MKENKASITIDASPQIVWQVLTDLNSYPEWNPLFVQASGTIATGQTLTVHMRLPLRIFCGAPLSYTWSPTILKVEPNSCLEWFAPAAGIKGFIDGTHYFQLVSSHNGTVTEFTQGERYNGWGTGLYAGFGTMEDARRGFVAMNTALQIESVRRKHLSEDSAEDQENNNRTSRQEEEVEQLDISDPAAVAAVHPQLTVATATAKGLATSPKGIASMTEDEVVVITEKETAATSEAGPVLSQDASPQEEKVKEMTAEQMDQSSAPSAATAAAIASAATEKPVEKRTSIIGAMSSIFSPCKANSPERVRASLSKENLISKSIIGETDSKEDTASTDRTVIEEDEDEDEENEDDEQEQEDPEAAAKKLEAKLEREKKNSERIELDLGTVGELSLGDFGF